LISLLVFSPLATARIYSKICRPTSSTGVPLRITPALMFMSSNMCSYIGVLVDSDRTAAAFLRELVYSKRNDFAAASKSGSLAAASASATEPVMTYFVPPFSNV
jgi:hypothetical protein